MSGLFDVILIDGSADDFVNSLYCGWLQFKAASWETVCELVALAQAHGLNLILYPKAEEAAADVEAEEAQSHGQT